MKNPEKDGYRHKGEEQDRARPPAPAHPRFEWLVFVVALGVAGLLLWLGPSQRKSTLTSYNPETVAPFRLNLGVIHLLDGYGLQAHKIFMSAPDSSLSSLRAALAGIAQSTLKNNSRALAFYDEADALAGAAMVPLPLRTLDQAEGRKLEENWAQYVADLSLEGHYLFAVWLIDSGRSELGLQLLQICKKKGFLPPLVNTALAAALIRAGNREEAIQHTEALQREGARTLGRLLEAMIKMKDPDPDEALHALRKVTGYATVQAMKGWLQSRIFKNLGRRLEEENALYRALGKDDDYTPAHLALALFYLQHRRLHDAEQSLARVWTVAPQGIHTLLTWAALLKAQGHQEKCTALRHQVLARNPDRFKVRKRLGLHYVKEQQFQRALTLLMPILTDGTRDVQTLKALLEAAEALQNQATTLAALKILHQRRAGDTEILQKLILTLRDMGKWSQVEKYMNQALDKDRLLPGELLFFLENCVTCPSLALKPRIRRIVKLLKENKKVSTEDLLQADSLLHRLPQHEEMAWCKALQRSLALQSCMLTRGKDLKSVTRLVDRYLEAGKIEELQEMLLFLLQGYPKEKEYIKLWYRVDKHAARAREKDTPSGDEK